MNPFLKQVSDYLKLQYPGEMEQVCIVFPNMRPALYFRRYFAQGNSQPVWTPEICTITQLFENASSLSAKDELSLMFDLYRTYIKLTSSAETFDNFYSWARVLLTDFDDVDTHLADAQKVFSNVKDLKEIDLLIGNDVYIDKDIVQAFWGNILSSRKSAERDAFLQTWMILPELYHDHRSGLKNENQGSQGMIYREVAENPERIDTTKTYLIVGFNVLNECEKRIFSFLSKEGKAVFLWDYDEYYMNNPSHEAGYFMRMNVKQFPMPPDFSLHNKGIRHNPPEITCIASPSAVAQVKYACWLVSEKIREGAFVAEETAIILGNEDLMPLVLQSLSSEIGPYNVSMGVSIKDSNALAWIRNIMLLQIKIRHAGVPRFYFKYVNALLNHPFTRLLSPHTSEMVSALRTQKIIYVSPEFFSGKNFLEELFQYSGGNVHDFSEYLLRMLSKVLTAEKQEDGFEVQREIVYQIYRSLKYIDRIIAEKEISFSRLATYSHLVDQIIKTTVVPFEGEPLQGLQVMGLLETRLLDFKNILILSVNEGVLPKNTLAPSFIPVNLRYAFHLPSQQHTDSLYSYYFYRLLQRSSSVGLIYKMATKDVGGGERSRFIQQLKFELPNSVNFKQINYSVVAKANSLITIPKNKNIAAFLNAFAEGKIAHKKLSASLLNQYIKCPLAFYFSTVAGISEPESVEEDTNMKQFGNIFHKAIELIYKEFALSGKTINASDLASIADIHNNDLVEKSLLQAFDIEYKTSFLLKSELQGKQRLIYEVLLKYIGRLLHYDMEKAPFRIASLEKQLLFSMPFIDGNNVRTALIKAKIDRVDVQNDSTVVLDYKTGKVERKFKNIAALFEPGRGKEMDYFFQILLYCVMLKNAEKIIGKVRPGLISLRNLKDDSNCTIHIKNDTADYDILNIEGELENEFSVALQDLIAEIVNPRIPFVQYPEKTKCSYCIYNTICSV
ncbi:MAG TPA: PD-(D/E)XK nuclease family protein [Bacteroidales bacterium]|nr:PD-(D/E)XK nuclease family protein [Bacteroidales bacterium]